MSVLLAIFLGGGLGSLARYGISVWLGKHSSGFPTGTLVANILACILLALVWSYAQKHIHMNEQLKAMLMVGFCGGFSTFSTFSFETFALLQEGAYGLALLYVGTSVLACLAVIAWVVRLYPSGE
ncbi:MAG: fluoride efflux transporter CrcB [Bacteroidota bacterium]